MFYPVDSLKRGGRFYLCWVADSWPVRFESISHRQLWSQDIRKICDELIEVVSNESGRPTNRYSLRLSSQLMRGLVRLYQRKVTVVLEYLCMINAKISKQVNKKFTFHEVLDLPQPERLQPQALELPWITVQQEPETELRVEEMIQNSGNVVANIQDITLKEAVIPEFLLPPNDGFGEENPEQTLQFLTDRTMEMMMAPTEVSAAQHSGVDVTVDVTDKLINNHSFKDKSRLAPPELQMERLSEHDITLFRQSDGASLLPGADFEKDIPDISDVPIPELSVPPEKQQQEPAMEIPEILIEPPREEAPRDIRESQRIELEELEETEPPAKRRKFRGRLIIDKKTKISSNVLRARIENPRVELRCEDSTDEIIVIRVPYDVYFRRPCHAGHRDRSNLGLPLTRLFMRNLGVVNKPTRVERDIEEGVMERSLRTHLRPTLQRVEEVEEPIMQEIPQPQVELAHETTLMNLDNLIPPDVDQTKDVVNGTERREEQDIADMLTQKLETLSQQARKRTSEYEAATSPKRVCSVGYVSFRMSQKKNLERETITATEAAKEPEIAFHIEVDKENVPANKQTPFRVSANDVERSITAMLQEAGLSDIPPQQPMETEQPAVPTQSKISRRQGSESSETPLGSLDRTKVSLGESDQTTDSMRFIKDEWGIEGTMLKILDCIKKKKQSVTVKTLIAKGPVIPGLKAIIAARCFNSILTLKSHDFIKIKKCTDSLEMEDITLGAKFY